MGRSWDKNEDHRFMRGDPFLHLIHCVFSNIPFFLNPSVE